MGDSWRHVLTHIQVGACNRNKAGGRLCHVQMKSPFTEMNPVNSLILPSLCYQIYRTKSTGGDARGLKDVVLENTNSLLDFTGEFSDCIQ